MPRAVKTKFQRSQKGKKGFQPNIPYPEEEKPKQVVKDGGYELPEVELKIDGNTVVVTRQLLTPEIVAVALYQARGQVSVAARLLGTTARTVNIFVKDNDICRLAAEEAAEMLLDFVEAKLFQKIKAGDIASIIFYLRTKGKHRGYTEKQIVEKTEESREAIEDMKRDATVQQNDLLDRINKVGQRLEAAPSIDLSNRYYNTSEDDSTSSNGHA